MIQNSLTQRHKEAEAQTQSDLTETERLRIAFSVILAQQ